MLDDTRLGDEGLHRISKTLNLDELRASRTNITDAGLAHLSEMPALRCLFVNRTQITDRGLKYLIDCPKLSILFVKETEVTPEGAAQLRAASWHVSVFGPDQRLQIERLKVLLPGVKFQSGLLGN
jgi:hypothetical protein